VIYRNIDRVGWDPSIDTYLSEGGYDQLKKALSMEPKAFIDEVKKSGLRGRGGAGFPTGVKWTFIPPNNTKPVYLICNCDESEPGTFKDRRIVHQDPHQLIEGMIIACYAVGAHLAYIYMREEFPEAAQIVTKALAEARERGFLGSKILGTDYDLEIYLHRGAGAYVCGEETALINSLEGVRPYPRIKPPFFPAAIGLYGCPTIVNNVESLCQVKHIIEMGGEAYSKVGAQRSPGTRIVGVSGDVVHPGYYEIISGSITYGELLYDLCGGPREGRTFKAVIPGGSSSKVMRCDAPVKLNGKECSFFDIPMDLDSIAQCGSMSGSGGVIVMDDSRSMPWILNNINKFYAHESCGQCTPCREGCPWMRKLTDRILAGQASSEDIDLLVQVANQIEGKTVCAFGEAAAWPTQAMVAKFREEFEALTKPINALLPHNPEAKEQLKFLVRE
jgi:NADH-quinone oxidoreductase subunit F